jgi:thiamine biosynthesis protein ThiS
VNDAAACIQLNVNGRPVRAQARCLSELLAHLDVREATVVAEINGRIVPREDFAHCLLREGDVVELARFVGGG